jgi:hypothetical protein
MIPISIFIVSMCVAAYMGHLNYKEVNNICENADKLIDQLNETKNGKEI